MPATAADQACVDKLHGVTAFGATLVKTVANSGRNLFPGRIVPVGVGVPQQAVFCEATGGPVNQPYIGVSKDWQIRTVQVRIRGKPQDESATLTTALAVKVALHRATVTGYTYCLVREPAPGPVFIDANGCPNYFWNVDLGITE